MIKTIVMRATFFWFLVFNSIQSFGQEWEWVDRVASNGNNYVFNSKVDLQEGTIYSTGRVKGVGTFGEASTPVTVTWYGDRDVYLTKHDADGTLLWVKVFGGIYTDYGSSIETDDNYVYLSGYFMDTVVIFNDDTIISNGLEDIFMAKFLKTDGSLVWVKTFGGIGHDQGLESDIDEDGNIYLVGAFYDSIQFDGFELQNTIDSVAFPYTKSSYILKMNGTDGSIIWAKKQQSTRDINHNDIMYKDGFCYLVGVYNGIAEFYPSASLIMNTGYWNSYAMKIDSAGNLIWLNGFGGISDDILATLDFDEHNNIFISGMYKYTSNYGPFVFSSPISYQYNGMVIKMDTSGTVLGVIGFPDTGYGQLDGLEVVDDRVYVGGYFTDSLFINNDTLLGNGLYDILMIALDTSLQYQWCSTQGGTNYDQIRYIDAFADHSIVFGGSIRGTVIFPNVTYTTLINTYDGVMGVVIPPLEARIKNNTQLACTGSDVTFYNNSIGSDDVVGWNTNGLPVIAQNNDSITVQMTAPGIFDIKLIVSNMSEADSVISLPITVYDSPVVDVGVDSLDACIGAVISLTAMGVFDAVTWSTTESTTSIDVASTGWFITDASIDGQCFSSDSVYVSFVDCTGIEVIENNIQFIKSGQVIYFKGTSNPTTFCIVDIAGRVIDKGTILSNQINLIDSMAPGSYVLVCDGFYNYKFIIE